MSAIHYARHFGKGRELHAYSIRRASKNIFDGANINIHEGDDSNWKCYFQYFKYCRKNKTGLFHLLNTGPVILLLTLLAGARHPVYHIHGTIYWNSIFKKTYLKTAWWLSSLFKVSVVSNSEHSSAIFREKVLPVEQHLIYNGFETGPFLENRSHRTRLERMGYAGRLYHGKNVDLVIRLFEEIAGEHPRLECWIAGDGPLRPALEAQASESLYADRVKFLGHVQDMASFFGSIDLFVFVSAYESFGNVLAEALLTGLPILTSDIPVFNEIHGGEEIFQLGNPSDYPLLREKFLKAVQQYPQLSARAYSLSGPVREKFNIEKHLQKIQALYEHTS